MDECKPLLVGAAADPAIKALAAQVAALSTQLGGAVQVDPIKPTLKPPGTDRLKLKYDEPPSNFAFKFNLRRYSWARSTAAR